MRRGVLAGLGALLAAASVVVAPAASAASGLPLSGFGDVVVDAAHRQVFVSGGPSSNGVVVVDFNGLVRKTIPNQAGADGLELSADGSRLFVALSAGDAVSAIDTVTLTEAARYPTEAGSCPTHLARTGDVVWFGYGCAGTWAGKIGKLDPAAATPVQSDRQGATRFQRAPLLPSSGAAAAPMVAGRLSLSQSLVQVYTVADGALAPGASSDAVGANLTDLDVTGDGVTLFSAAGSRDRVEGFATQDFARRGAYATRPRPVAVALSPDDAHVVTGTSATDLLIYPTGGATPTRTITLDGGETLLPRGLAWSADQEYLAVVSRQGNEAQPRLSLKYRPLGW